MQFLSVKEVLEKIGVSRATLYRWIDDKELGFPQPAKLRKRIFWDSDQLEKWMQAQAAAAQQQQGGQA